MSGDLISRSALARMYNDRPDKDIWWCIKHIPAVEAEPVVHAHWVVLESSEDSSLCECSACKEWHTFYGGEYSPKRCPECGAHMDEEVT